MRKRDEIMDEFISSRKALISNARCLVEGVNVPSVDMVSFTHQKESEVDIVQAIGRALRNRNQSKKFGYVLVPVFVERNKNESFEEALERTNFKKVIILLKALREHDTEIAQIIDEILINEGRGKGFSLKNRKKISDLIETVNPEIERKILIKSIHSKLIANLRLKWDLMVGQLLDFKNKYKHLNVSNKETEFAELRQWVTEVRKSFRDNKLYNFQVEQLTKIGFKFNEPGVTLFSPKKNCYSISKWSRILKVGRILLVIALKDRKPDEYFWGPGKSEPVAQYENLTEEMIKKKLKVSSLTVPKNLFPASKLHQTLFKGKKGSTHSSYGLAVIKKLIDEKKIVHIETAISSASNKKDEKGNYEVTKYYKPLDPKKITKLTGINVFEIEKYALRTKFLKNIFGSRKHDKYFQYCIKNKKIKHKGYAATNSQELIGKVYKQLSKKQFMGLFNLTSMDVPKGHDTFTSLAKKIGKDRSLTKKLIEFKLIKKSGTAFIGATNPIADYYKVPNKEKLNKILKKYLELLPKKKRNKYGQFLN